MLPQAIMKILSDAALLASADLENRFFEVLPLRDVDAGGDDVLDCSILALKNRSGPRDQPGCAIPGEQIAFEFFRHQPGRGLVKHRFEFFSVREIQKQFGEQFPLHVIEEMACGLLTGAIEAHDPAARIKNYDQSSHRVENRRKDISLLLQGLFRLLEPRDIESDSVDEPWLTIVPTDDSRLAVEPQDPAVASHYTIGRAQ